MAIKEVNFTKNLIEKLPSPAKGREYYRDSDKKLYLYVTSSGIKTFYIRKNVNGKDDKIVLGNFPDLSIDNACKKSLEARNDIANGVHPKDKKKAKRGISTFEEAFKDFLDKHAKAHKKTVAEDIRVFNKLLSPLKNKQLDQIFKDEIQKLHLKIGEVNGKIQSNRALQLISTIYNKAILFGYNGKNPTIGIQKFKEKSRERFLQPEEIANFFEALNKLQSIDIRDYIIISLLTGVRRTNILSMKWQDINFERATLYIEDTKNGESFTTPLSSQVMEILTARKSKAAKGAIYVFPSKTSKSGHLMEPKTSWKTLLKLANISNLRIHDLRRTLGSWQTALGANSYIIGKSLGHKSQAATAIYARLNLEPVRQSVQSANDEIMKFINTKDEERSE